MKVALLFIIALVCSQAIHSTNKLNKSQKENYTQLRNGNTWAGFFVRLAEVQVMTHGGALDELIDAIEQALEELAYKREKADAAFEKRTDEHIAEVQRLEGLIANTETQIAEIEDTLQLLADQKAALEEEIRELTAENARIVTAIADATTVRKMEHEAFEAHVVEYNEGLAAVDECLALLNELQVGGSFAQVKKIQTSLAQIHTKLRKSKSTDNHILLALVEMAANQEFADSGAVGQVITKFNEIRANLQSSLNKAIQDEETSQQEFEDFVSASNQQIFTNEGVISDNNDALVVNAANTEENQTMLALRKQDLANFQQELQDEIDSYEAAKAAYEDLCAQFDAEVAACQQALQVLSTADFADYITDRVTAEDGLVSSGMAGAEQHGMGTEVFNFDYQF